MKTNITLSIDSGVIESIRNKNLNVSLLCESHLREINNSFIVTSNPETCEHKFTSPFTIPRGLAKECLKCGVIVFVDSPVKKESWKNIRTG